MSEAAGNLDLRLYLITPAQPPMGGYLSLVSQAVAGGVTLIQLRCKGAADRQLWERAVRLRRLTRRLGVPLIINDRVDLALAVDADGCHVGDWDLPPAAARRLLGPGRILGASADTAYRLQAAVAAGVDYLGVGPVYSTGTKEDAGDAKGVNWLGRLIEGCPVPVVGIGGIGPGRAGPVVAAGASGVAVVSAVALAHRPRQAAARLRREVDEALTRQG